MSWYHEAAYNKITGDWEPAEFGTHYTDMSRDRDQLHYPPLLHKTNEERENYIAQHQGGSWDKAWDNFYPHPDQHNISVGNGHQLQAQIWRNYNNSINPEYRIHGIARTEEEANAQADKYLDYHTKKFGIQPDEIKRRDYENDDDDYSFSNFYVNKPLNMEKMHVERYVKPLYLQNGKIFGYSWEQTHYIPTNRYDSLDRDNSFAKAQSDILSVHKELHDLNNQNKKQTFAKVYTTDIDEEGYYITKVADRMSPEEVGPGFTGADQQDQTLDGTVDNEPREVSETIPGNSFFTHDPLASRLFLAELEDTNYEGVGSVFGEGMGPADLSNNVTNVEEGPKGPKSTEKSTTQLPGALQGQSVLPDLTSWYTAAKNYNQNNDYGYYDVEYNLEDEYDDNYTW